MRFALVVALGLITSAFAQNLTPKLSVVWGIGFGCTDANFVAGTDVYGSTSCDNPAAGILSCSVDENGEGGCSLNDYAGWEGESFYGSYYITDTFGRNGDGTYFHGRPGDPYSGPIYPLSEAGSWFVGGYDMISHSGVFVPTAGGHTFWSRVITNPRGDAFVLGSTDSGPVLAKFGWNGSQVYRVSLHAFGLIGVSDLARDKGGNLYLSGRSSTSGKVVKLNAVATKAANTKDLEVSGRIYVDGYAQAYVVGKAPAGMTSINAPQPLPGGGDDGFVTVVSVDGKRVIYQTYVGGERDESVHGGGIYSDGSVSIGGNSTSHLWLGMDWCFPGGNDSNCKTPVYYAKVGPYMRGSLPAKASFGTILVGSTKTINIVYKNVGNAPIRALRVFPGLFQVSPLSCEPIVPGKSCSFRLTWNPTKAGTISSTFSLASDTLDGFQVIPVVGKAK